MLLGTWHFNYPNADSYQVDSSNMVDLSTPSRQKEILDVVDRLSEFEPTIICVEVRSKQQDIVDSAYSSYINGDHDLTISEVQQLGFRVAERNNIRKIHAVDTYSWLRDNHNEPVIKDIWDEEYFLDTAIMHEWSKRYFSWYEAESKLIINNSVDEVLRIFNHPLNLKRKTGNYLVEIKTSNHNGPDSFALKWYDRNVRIFNNILKTNPQPEDKILVIYGVSHVSILEQLFDASPQFELVRPYKY